MTNVEVDWDWTRDQLKHSDYADTDEGVFVLTVLEALEKREYPVEQIDEIDKILTYAGTLFKGQPVAIETEDENWVDLRGGDLVVRDTVRIKPDAYTGQAGRTNNGKRGRVTAMRNGKISVLLDGDPVEQARGHDITALQKLDVE